MIKLGLHLNQLSLNNGEKQKFFNNFNKNVNLNTIMKNASNFDAKKKAGIKTEQLANLKKFMNQQGLNAGEQNHSSINSIKTKMISRHSRLKPRKLLIKSLRI